MNIDLLLNRITFLCNEKGISLHTAFIESGVGKNFKSNMKTSCPSMGKITMLANYFEVSVDYLLGKTDIKKEPTVEGELSDKAMQLVKVFDSLDEETQDAILEIVERIVGKE